MRLVDVCHSGEPDGLTSRRQNSGQSELRAVPTIPLVLRLDHDHTTANVQDQARAIDHLFAAEILAGKYFFINAPIYVTER